MEHGKALVLDGAVGTELERRGVEASGSSWTSKAIVTHPGLIREIHKEYVLAGADIITANTFRTNPRAHRSTGLDAHQLTIRAVELAIEARKSTSSRVRIAASVAPVEDCFFPELAPDSESELLAEHEEFISWLVEAGADLILIETMSTLREASIALKAARSASNLPVYVSLVPQDENALLDGNTIEDAISVLSDANLIALNCAELPVISATTKGFARQARAAGLQFGIYPNASGRKFDGTWELHSRTDDDIAEAARGWADAGAALIGSCCGTTPSTTRAIVRALNRSID